MADVNRALAAERVMVRNSEEVLGESKRIMARWRVTSAAKYARRRDPTFLSTQAGIDRVERTHLWMKAFALLSAQPQAFEVRSNATL